MKKAIPNIRSSNGGNNLKKEAIFWTWSSSSEKKNTRKKANYVTQIKKNADILFTTYLTVPFLGTRNVRRSFPTADLLQHAKNLLYAEPLLRLIRQPANSTRSAVTKPNDLKRSFYDLKSMFFSYK